MVDNAVKCVLMAVFAVLLAASADAELIWTDQDGAAGNSVWGYLGSTGNCGSPSSVTIGSEAGRGSVFRFRKPASSNRCETHGINVGGGQWNPQEGGTYYLGWWSRLTSTANNNANFQWKSYGSHIQNFPVILKIINGRMNLMYREPGEPCCHVVWSTPISANVWNHYVLAIHVRSSESSGWIEFWFNGVHQTLTNGSTRFHGRTHDDINHPKWGVYGGTGIDMSNYLDDVRVGTALADVLPGGGGGGGGGASIGTGRTQAESLTKTLYETNTFEGVTGARATSTSTGNVRGTFSGASGSYDVTVRYFDENDGQSSFALRVDGATVGSWTANVDDHAWKTRTFSGVPIGNGDEIRVEGARESGEHARVDYVDVVAAASAVRVQAEAMTKTLYETNTFEGVTGARATSTSTGNVRTTFPGGGGVYTVRVRYMDENDGRATFTLRVNGVPVDSWTASVDDHSWKVRTIGNVSIPTASEIRVEAARQAGEHARVDYIEFQ